MRRLVTLLALLALVLVPACGGGDDGAGDPYGTEPTTLPPLRVGLEAEYHPFETKTPDGEFEGFDVDLVRRLGEKLGREVEIQDLAFDTLLLKLRAGDLDMVCSGLSYTEERAQRVDFSEPYVRLPMSILVSTSKAPDVTSAADLDEDGVVISVQRGTTGAKKARARFTKATIREYDKAAEAANEIVVGRVHAFVYDAVTVHEWWKKNPDTTRVLEDTLGDEQYCIAFRQGSPLVEPVNAFLTDPANEAWFESQMDRWFEGDLRTLFVR